MFRLLTLSPPYGWRAVGWELAIVTLGVLIALIAQQWAEDRSSRRRAAAAEEAMVLEIENSLLASAELSRLNGCRDAQLLALQDAIVSGDRSASSRIVKGASIGGAGRLWADNAFGRQRFPSRSHRPSQRLSRIRKIETLLPSIRYDQDGSPGTGRMGKPGGRSNDVRHNRRTRFARNHSLAADRPLRGSRTERKDAESRTTHRNVCKKGSWT
jgi:hypothetical protein